MKEKRKALPDPDVASESAASSNEEEALSEVDKSLLENTKLKRELALANVKTVLTQSENAELVYNNVILQLALKYKLSEGDIITEDGTIKRNKK